MNDIVHRAPLKETKCCFEKFYKKYQSSRSGMLLLGEQEEVRREKKKRKERGWRRREDGEVEGGERGMIPCY